MLEWFGLIEEGSDLPAELLGSERALPDCCFIDVGVLVPERSPVVSARGAAVPTSLPTITEVFFLCCFLLGVVSEAAPLAEVGTVTARVFVLPDAGRELPAVSDRAAIVRAAFGRSCGCDWFACWTLVDPDGFEGCFAADD